MNYEDRELSSEELYEMRLFRLAEAMQRYGGSFARKISEAFYVADENNREKLLNAFNDLFESYEHFIERRK